MSIRPNLFFSQTWEIYEGDLTSLSSSLQPILEQAGVKFNLLKEPLANVVPFVTAKKVDESFNPEAFVIWENEDIKVCMPNHPLVTHHVTIILKNQNGEFANLAAKTGLELFKTIQKIGHIFKQFGFYGFVIAISNENPICHLIPPSHIGPYKDALEKADVNRFTLFPNALDMPKILPRKPITADKIKQMVLQWQQAFNHNFKPIGNEHQPKVSYETVTTNTEKANDYLIECIFQSLQGLGIAIKRSVSSTQIADLPKQNLIQSALFASQWFLKNKHALKRMG
jgi:hypothetical protein